MSPTWWEDRRAKGTSWYFVETPEFSSIRDDYFPKDRDLAEAQSELIEDPERGDLMPGCGGMRKLRLPDPRRGKGKRGGLRLLYLQIPSGRVILMVDVYDKDEASDLTPAGKRAIHALAIAIKEEWAEHSRKGRRR